LCTLVCFQVSFYSALAVIVVPLLDSFISGKQLEKETVVSVAIATAGVALLQLGPPVGGATMSITMGDLFCLGQTLFFGIGYWRLEKVSKKFPTQASRNTVGQLVALAGGSIAYCLLAGGGVPSLSELQEWLVNPFIIKALLWTGLVSTALALYLETVAMEFVSASELTILMTSVSLWGSAFAFIAMGEVLSPAGMVGGLMILAGCVVSSTKATPKEEEDGKDRENSIPEINNVY
jgi:drug/metabolite transporter (DMT)-like permease